MSAFLSARMCAAIAIALAAGVALAGCVRVNVHGDPGQASREAPLRVASYNVSLYSDESGGLLRRLRAGDGDARKVAAVLQRVRPDVVLLNEFDFDAGGQAADVFQRDYLEVPQPQGSAALRYPYRYFAPVNTGVPSGLDLDRSGHVASATPVPGADAAAARGRGNDAWGYGLHPGQYGMLLLSKYPIDTAGARTFQHFRWSRLPDAARPIDPETGAPWHDDAIWAQLRLSSKSHWDVPVRTPLGTVHMLASHPTPPVFDGPEDRNGARNHDEIRLWHEYIDGAAPWLCDDDGRCGGLPADARFVILGDLNNDPADGDGRHEAILDLLAHPRVLRMPAPSSAGAAQAAAAHWPARRPRVAHATGDFGPRVGPLRLDYVLPSTGFTPVGASVYWPAPGEDGAGIVDGTDHRLVWVDLAD